MTTRGFKTLIFLAALLFATSSALWAADTYKIDGVHSNAFFQVRHLTISDFVGRFDEVSGTIVFDPDHPSASSVTIEIAADSVDTHSDRRNNHVKSPDFLNAAQFPTLTFKSTSVEKTGEHTYQVSGDLTIRGVTKAITTEVKHEGTADTRMGYRSGFSTKFTINRRDFNVNYGTPDVVGDEMTIMVVVEGVRQ